MLSVVKAAGATPSNGALQLVYQDTQGILRDVFAASYQILDSTFVQVFPGSGRQNLAVTGADHAGTGRYNATWTPGSAAVGRYMVRWYLTPNSGDPEISFDQDFELVTQAYRGPYYCSVPDLRDEGLASSVTDAQAQGAIVRASRYVEFFTGRTFYPSYRTMELDGIGARALLFEEPIVAIEKVIITFDSIVSVSSQATDLTSLKIYNRHLRQGLVMPDDRQNPKIEFIGDAIAGVSQFGSLLQNSVLWPSGVRNLQVTGLFGFTEQDASYTGHTPDLIREATKLTVFENLTTMSRGGPGTRGPITRERTRDQEVDYSPLRVTGMTGNRSIDVLLAGFKRLPSLGSA